MSLTSLHQDCFNYLLSKLPLDQVVKMEVVCKKMKAKIHGYYLKILNDNRIESNHPKEILIHIATWNEIPADFQSAFALFRKKILKKGSLRVKIPEKELPNQSCENMFTFQKSKNGEVHFEILSYKKTSHDIKQEKESYLLKEIRVIDGTEIEDKIAQNKVKNRISSILAHGVPSK